MNQPTALFLDRDGVINVDRGYVHKPEDCEFLPGIFDLTKRATAIGLLVIIVTNQAGIARGYYSEEQFHAFMRWMQDRFAERGTTIARVYHCPHHPEAGEGDLRQACECRKPAPGLFRQAEREFGIDMGASWIVGDKLTDMAAAKAAGVGNRVLLSAANSDVSEAGTIDPEFFRVLSLGSIDLGSGTR